jgi:hypothetical protein
MLFAVAVAVAVAAADVAQCALLTPKEKSRKAGFFIK